MSTRSRESDDGVDLALAVMAHPTRLDRAHALARRFDTLNAYVVVDDAPPGQGSAARTAQRVWASRPVDASHLVVLQDDAEPCTGLAERVREIATTCREQPVCLMSEWASASSNLVRFAAWTGQRFVENPDAWVSQVGIVLPAVVADAAAVAARAVPQDDVVLARVVRELGVTPLIAVPNLVEHASLPSLVGNTFQGSRRSALFGPAPASFGDAGPARFDRVPVMSRTAGVPFYLTRGSDGGLRPCTIREAFAERPRILAQLAETARTQGRTLHRTRDLPVTTAAHALLLATLSGFEVGQTADRDTGTSGGGIPGGANGEVALETLAAGVVEGHRPTGPRAAPDELVVPVRDAFLEGLDLGRAIGPPEGGARTG
jgi:hypothetical protein